MSSMGPKILDLRSQGKTYNQIAEILNCSKGLISYHCGEGQKQKTKERQRKLHPYLKKIIRFQNKVRYNQKVKGNSSIRQLIHNKISLFCKGGERMFSVDQVIEKFGEEPICYLTGEQINIYQPRTYHFDHIIPRSRGGDSSIENLGICTKEANQAKHDMTEDEFIMLCKRVLIHNNYQVVPDGLEPSSSTLRE
jgi:5-methylcytosine-specific restriction endonuclease McrA